MNRLFPTSLTITSYRLPIFGASSPYVLLPYCLASNSTSNTLPAKPILKPINPKAQFRENMREIRKRYAAEYAVLKSAQDKAAVTLILKEEERQKAKMDDIAKFKSERRRTISDFAHENERSTLVNEALINNNELSAGGMEKNKKDPFTASRHCIWKSFIRERRERRFAAHIHRQHASSERRLETLMYLYHSAAEFVTYSNLDEKVSELFDYNYYVRPTPTVPQLLENRAVKGVTFSPGVYKGLDVGLGVARERALKDAIMGTIAGKMGMDGVYEWKTERARKGGEETEGTMDEKTEAFEREQNENLLEKILKKIEEIPEMTNGDNEVREVITNNETL